MNINLDLYKIFYYVAKNENITRAANELMISQPAISRSIKTLEEQIGLNFFIRKRDGVILSEAGHLIFEKIKNSMELIESAENDLKSLSNLDKGVINIGASKTIIHEFLMSYIKLFHIEFPNINIRIFTDKTNDLIDKAKLGLIDVIFTNMPTSIPDSFEELPLMELQDCFVANNSFEYLKNKTINISELSTLPLLVLTKGAVNRIRFDDFCVKNNITIKPEMEFSSNSLIKEFTIAGFGIGMLTKEHVKEELENGTLFEIKTDININPKHLSLLFNTNYKRNITKKFIDFIISKKDD